MNIDVESSTKIPYTIDDFRIIAKIAHLEFGIALSEAKVQLVYSRLAGRLRELNLSRFRDYCDLINGDAAEGERRVLVSLLTTNVTRFRREPHHYADLADRVLPALIKRARLGDRVRFWSAACATGEEAYEIAFEILALCPEAPKHDIKILATDIDQTAIAAAIKGRYATETVSFLTEEWIKRNFSPRDPSTGCHSVTQPARDLITFRVLNLTSALPFKGTFDAVFCRNVAIYFDTATQSALWSRIVGAMAPRATLYLGHSERIRGPAVSQFLADGVTTFRKRAPGDHR